MYIKQNFTDGQVLTAAQLEAMEEGILSAAMTNEDRDALVQAVLEALPDGDEVRY